MGSELGEYENWEEAMADVPPSAKLVFKVLQYEGDLTQQQLAEETRLVPRTIRYALERLEQRDLVTSKVYFADARQEIYSLTIDPMDEQRDA